MSNQLKNSSQEDEDELNEKEKFLKNDFVNASVLEEQIKATAYY